MTAPLPAGGSYPAGTEAVLVPVSEWGGAGQATLAINANFFSKTLTPSAGAPDPGWVKALPVDLVGLSVSDGRVVSPPRVLQGRGDPALLILRAGRARIGYVDRTDLPGLACAVAGIGPTDKGAQPGTLLVTGGRNTGATARVQPAARHPRTAAGLTADGRTLILVVVDGRQPGYSVGLKLPELADLLIELGAADAINLDGGGSSSFLYQPGNGPGITNRPSDGHWRPVGNHLGVWLRRR
ncbi:MAG: phosphodiester glycosidase family protein [Opitutae bacterium]|nr:phosphodiester glycosidase family protein [Opitutae bacterium]